LALGKFNRARDILIVHPSQKQCAVDMLFRENQVGNDG